MHAAAHLLDHDLQYHLSHVVVYISKKKRPSCFHASRSLSKLSIKSIFTAMIMAESKRGTLQEAILHASASRRWIFCCTHSVSHMDGVGQLTFGYSVCTCTLANIVPQEALQELRLNKRDISDPPGQHAHARVPNITFLSHP